MRNAGRLCLLGVIAVAGLGAFVLLFGRVSDASGNLVERFYHAKDGLALWLTSPLVGIGPDQWHVRLSVSSRRRNVTPAWCTTGMCRCWWMPACLASAVCLLPWWRWCMLLGGPGGA